MSILHKKTRKFQTGGKPIGTLHPSATEDNVYTITSPTGQDITNKTANWAVRESLNAAANEPQFSKSANAIASITGGIPVTRRMGFKYSQGFPMHVNAGKLANDLQDNFIVGSLINQGKSTEQPIEYPITKAQYMQYRGDLNNLIENNLGEWTNLGYYFDKK